MASDKVLIINTGGTIGMVNEQPLNPLSPLRPADDLKEIFANHPILKPKILEIETDMYSFQPLLDSSDITYENWKQMAEVISSNYNKYKGFVILHGTDTMCYTASALSFMLENLDKPVIITGSQIPMVRPRSDAAQNLVTSIQIAASDNPLIPEVCIFFSDVLIRGNRARKYSSSGYSGFVSPNYTPLATAGEHIDFGTEHIRSLPPKQERGAFFANTFLETHVMVLEIFPGFDPQILLNMFKEETSEEDRIRGLVLKTFGAGNAPSNSEFLSAIEHINEKGAIIVDVTQCFEGIVELGLYESSSGLLNRGVTSGLDMTPEATICKLMYLLGKGWENEDVKKQMQLDQRGEQSLNIYNVDFGNPAQANPTYRTGKTIPGEINFAKFSGASIRFQEAKHIDEQQKDVPLKLKIFFNHPGANETTPTDDPRCAGIVERKFKEGESSSDLFYDISSITRGQVTPGQTLSVTIVAEPGKGIKWKKMSVSIYTEVS